MSWSPEGMPAEKGRAHTGVRLAVGGGWEKSVIGSGMGQRAVWQREETGRNFWNRQCERKHKTRIKMGLSRVAKSCGVSV